MTVMHARASLNGKCSYALKLFPLLSGEGSARSERVRAFYPPCSCIPLRATA